MTSTPTTKPRIITTKQLMVPMDNSTWMVVFTCDGPELTIGLHWGDKDTPTHVGTVDSHLMRELMSTSAHINLLEELAKHPGWEMSMGHKDGDEEGEYGWCVHEIRGGINDREWYLIGFGDTPAMAIMRAIEASQ